MECWTNFHAVTGGGGGGGGGERVTRRSDNGM